MLRVSLALAALVGGLLLAGGMRQNTLPFPPEAAFSDAAISRYPDALHFQRSLTEDGVFPLWNAHLMGGQPFAANPGTKVWYPLTWGLLIWPPALHVNLLIFFHLWLAGLGMWFWGRRSGLAPWPGLVAAAGFALSPRLIAHGASGHTDLLMGMAWLPWMLYALHHILTERPTPARVVGLGGVGALMFIGALQLAHLTFGVAGLYAFSLAFQRGKLPWQPLVGGGLVMVGLSAVQWVPLLELRDVLSRGDIRVADAALFSLSPAQGIGLLIGTHGGGAETLTYTGIGFLLLALAGLLLRPRAYGLWWGVIFFAALYALGENFVLWTALAETLPPIRWFRVPGRAWLLVAFAIPYLAAWGLQSLIETPPQLASARLTIIGVIGLGFTCTFSSLILLQQADIPRTALVGILALPLTGITIAWIIFSGTAPRALLFVMFLVLVGDVLWINRTLIENRPASEWLTPQPPAPLANLAHTGRRFYTPDYSIPQQDSAYWGIARFDGVDPFQMEPFIRLAQRATGVEYAGYSTTVPAVVVLAEDNASLIHQNAPMDARLLAMWGVDWVVTGYRINIPGLVLAEQQDGIFYYQNVLAPDGLELDWHDTNTLEIIGQTQQARFYAAVAVPGWQPSPADDIGLSAEEERYRYDPTGVRLGVFVSAMTLLFALGGVAWGWYRER